ncbi:MAG: tRNA 2-methylthio-N6-isopentenyl adenosine(37) hydroxylase MiaE [Crocinitomicaceae bacterium]|nr:tRNA 2-methylthio-N6-isopentenyl adenosine(37) hydroxylase MiaE [Crocinitomicaceae bacterium]
MLGLKLETDPRWIDVASENIEQILIDHAFCEQKAASNAISIIVQFPQYTDLVKDMTAICIEEMEHFGMVHEKLIERGLKLGFERKDHYVNDILKFLKKNISGTKECQFVNQMLFAAIIEARSCERFKILSEKLTDKDLKIFYRNLMESEARHYTTFLKYARKYATTIDVEKRWQDLLSFEGSLMRSYGTNETIHG